MLSVIELKKRHMDFEKDASDIYIDAYTLNVWPTNS